MGCTGVQRIRTLLTQRPENQGNLTEPVKNSWQQDLANKSSKMNNYNKVAWLAFEKDSGVD